MQQDRFPYMRDERILGVWCVNDRAVVDGREAERRAGKVCCFVEWVTGIELNVVFDDRDVMEDTFSHVNVIEGERVTSIIVIQGMREGERNEEKKTSEDN